MLKHGRVFTRPKAWTMRYLRWLQEQKFDHPAHQIALQEMVEAVRILRSGSSASRERSKRSCRPGLWRLWFGLFEPCAVST